MPLALYAQGYSIGIQTFLAPTCDLRNDSHTEVMDPEENSALLRESRSQVALH